MFFKKKNRNVDCEVRVLFDILADNLRDGLCTDILFLADGKQHRFGAWGDAGNTYKNVVFYLDEQEYQSEETLHEHAQIDGVKLAEYNTLVTVTECDGCYPESTPRLKALMK